MRIVKANVGVVGRAYTEAGVHAKLALAVTDTTDTTDTEETAPNVFDILATVIDGTIRLSGRGLIGDTLVVPAGQDSLVRIKDVDGYYLYATEIPSSGARSTCWGRNTNRGLARRKFEAVTHELTNIVYAVSTRSSADVTYGPVLKVKPQG